MIKNIVAFSDIHLRPLKRHQEFKEQFNKLITEVKKISPDRVVIAGDIFHSKITISNEMAQIIAKLFRALANITKVIIIPGNHDAIINSPRLDSISPIIEMLNNPNIVYYKDSGVYVDNWDSEVAWAVWSCLENQKSPEIESFLKMHSNNKNVIGLYHGVINGSTTDLGFTFTDEGVDTEEFFYTDVFIAGDIHKHQSYTYKNYKGLGTGVMIGSFIQQDFGEDTDNHGFVYLEYKDDEWEFELNEIDNDYGFFTLRISDIDEIEEL